MKGRVAARLLFTDQATAEQLAANLDGEIRTRGTAFYDTTATAYPDYTGAPWIVAADARFDTRATADDIAAWVQTAWNSGNPSRRPLSGSMVRVHDCPHDDPDPFPCDTSALVEVVKP